MLVSNTKGAQAARHPLWPEALWGASGTRLATTSCLNVSLKAHTWTFHRSGGLSAMLGPAKGPYCLSTRPHFVHCTPRLGGKRDPADLWTACQHRCDGARNLVCVRRAHRACFVSACSSVLGIRPKALDLQYFEWKQQRLPGVALGAEDSFAR